MSMFKREISFKGTLIEYSGSNTTEERINCTERVEVELILQVSMKASTSASTESSQTSEALRDLYSGFMSSGDLDFILISFPGVVCGEPL